MSFFGGGISFGNGVSADQVAAITKAKMHEEIGFGVYRDTQYTADAPLRINPNTPVTLPNNAGNVVESQLPSDVTTFYNPNTQRIIGTLFSDIHITVDVWVKNIDAQASYIDYNFDVGPDGAPNVVGSHRLALPWGEGLVTPMKFILWGYCGASMIANGARIVLDTDGTIDVYQSALWIRRTHKGITT